MTALLGKVLASALLRRIIRALFISTLEQLAKKSDNKIDDEVVKAVKAAL